MAGILLATIIVLSSENVPVSDTPQIESSDETDEPSTATSTPDPVEGVPESTVGTGTAMALGCIAGTVVLIGFGLIFLFFATMR